jgi:hypothetical protein
MQLRMKQQADKKRSERIFSVGDMVFLKLQPYIQTSVARRANHKLSFKFYGPYRICKRIGEVAYELELPPSSRVHPVFHVSQLKPCIRPGQQVSPNLPALDLSHQILVAILQQRLRQHGLTSIAQVLVHWSGSPPEDATWEDVDDLKRRFPRAPAWGQAGFQEGGNVSDLAPPASEPRRTPPAQDPVARRRPVRQTRAPAWLAGHALG